MVQTKEDRQYYLFGLHSYLKNVGSYNVTVIKEFNMEQTMKLPILSLIDLYVFSNCIVILLPNKGPICTYFIEMEQAIAS